MKIKKPKQGFEHFMARMLKEIDDSQKHFWLNRKGECILSTNPFRLYENDGKRFTVKIDYFKEALPRRPRHTKYERFCREHTYIGRVQR